MAYQPRGTNKAILDRAMEHINSVPYRVSLRWCFYRLLQEGYYTCKEDYSKWKALASKARKEFYDGWNPTTFADGGREITIQAYGGCDETTAVKQLHDRLIHWTTIELDHFFDQDAVVVWMFEAATMLEQFRHYAPGIDLMPLRGDAGIEHKWNCAKHIDSLIQRYGRPVRVLYAGDHDRKGLQIPQSAMADIRQWSEYPEQIHFDRIEISPEQARRFNLPEKIGAKAGSYEWESLSDDQARSLIKGAMGHYINLDVVTRTYDEAERLTKKHKERIANLLLA